MKLMNRYLKKKNIASLLMVCLLSGCDVPGTYMTDNEVTRPVKTTQGKQQHIKVITINGKLMADHPEQNKLLAAAYEYKIGIHDQLAVMVWEHPEFSMGMTQGGGVQVASNGLQTVGQVQLPLYVNSEGKIHVPSVGNIKVAGLTTEELRTLLETRLSQFIRNPQVTDQVTAYRSQSVNILGEVGRQGQISITDVPVTILDAINSSGGINTDSNPQHIFVIRGDFSKFVVYSLDMRSSQAILLAENFLLQNKDILFVSSSKISNWNRLISKILPLAGAPTAAMNPYMKIL